MKRAEGWLRLVIASIATWVILVLVDGMVAESVEKIALSVAVASAVALGILAVARWLVPSATRTAKLMVPAAAHAIRTGGTSLLRTYARDYAEHDGEQGSHALRRILSTGGLSLITVPKRSQRHHPLSDG